MRSPGDCKRNSHARGQPNQMRRIVTTAHPISNTCPCKVPPLGQASSESERPGFSPLVFSEDLQDWLQSHLPDTEQIDPVCDSLNTRKPKIGHNHCSPPRTARHRQSRAWIHPIMPIGSTSRKSRSTTYRDGPWSSAPRKPSCYAARPQ